MILKVLGSTSKGNGYILEEGNEALIIEAGIPLSSCLNNTKRDKVVGLIASHHHGDHTGRINDYLNAAIDCWIGPDVEPKGMKPNYALHRFVSEEKFSIGRFDIIPFGLYHDVPNYGFLIRHPEMTGNLLFCTDTAKIPYTFENVQYLMIEADYDTEVLCRNENSGTIHPKVAQRIRDTHFSISSAISFCKNRNLANTRKIILIHLSKDNANADTFRQRMIDATGKPVYVAEGGLEVAVGDNPF